MPEVSQVAEIQWSPLTMWQVESEGHVLSIYRYRTRTRCDRDDEPGIGRVLAYSMRNPENYNRVLSAILMEFRRFKSASVSEVVTAIVNVQNAFVMELNKEST